jgi:glycosyltransferase involved in cell wall biosynthesis
MEANRKSWGRVNIKSARLRRVWGWQLRLNKHKQNKAFDHWYLHIEPGYIIDLVRERPEAVISFEMGFRTLVALAYGACFGKPVWVWWGGTVHTEYHVGRVRTLVRRLLARCTKRWISYGQTSTEYLLTLGVPRERILQVQNCVDESWYVKPAQPALDIQPRPVLLHVGRLVALKGVAEFFGAAAQLQAQGLRFSILLVGSGPEDDGLRGLAADLGLRNVHFHPEQPAEAMPAFYCGADMVVFPTMGDVWGLVANEAVLSGLPVLCSRYAGCAPELFDPECIFDPANEEEFVAALRRAVAGQLPRADRARLKSSSEVGDMIAEAVEASLAGTRPKSKGSALPRTCDTPTSAMSDK